jgi:hypothetical protein
MSLGDGMLVRRIIFNPIDRADLALTGNAAFELSADFLGAALFEWIGATAH